MVLLMCLTTGVHTIPLHRVVEASEEIRIHDIPVALSMVEVDRYHEEAAFVVHRWVETFEIPVGVAMLVRPPNVNLIFRSRIDGLHAGRVAQEFGGGGHPTAASRNQFAFTSLGTGKKQVHPVPSTPVVYAK